MKVMVRGEASALSEKLIVWLGPDGVGSFSLEGYESRHLATLRLVRRAAQDRRLPTFGPMLVHTGDRPVCRAPRSSVVHSFCTAKGYSDVLVPDFVFGGWPEVGIVDYDGTCAAVATAGKREPLTGLTGWIGNPETSPVRSVLMELGRSHPALLDVRAVTWTDRGPGLPLATTEGNALSLPDQAERWQAMIDVEGQGWSARLKVLLHSGRPVLVQERPWREWTFDRLVPMEHFVPVKADLSDLVERATWVKEHPLQAARIGRQGQAFAQQNLTEDAAVATWGRTLERQVCGARALHWEGPDFEIAVRRH